MQEAFYKKRSLLQEKERCDDVSAVIIGGKYQFCPDELYSVGQTSAM